MCVGGEMSKQNPDVLQEERKAERSQFTNTLGIATLGSGTLREVGTQGNEKD